MTRIEQLKLELANKRGQQATNTKEQLMVRVERSVRSTIIDYRKQRLEMLIELEASK